MDDMMELPCMQDIDSVYNPHPHPAGLADYTDYEEYDNLMMLSSFQEQHPQPQQQLSIDAHWIDLDREGVVQSGAFFDAANYEARSALEEADGDAGPDSTLSAEQEGKLQVMIPLSTNSTKEKMKSINKRRSHQGRRDSHSVMITNKPPRAFISPPQRRPPVIIYTYPPKIIHTRPSEFMWLVQLLTGSLETRSRCLMNPPHDHHDHLPYGRRSEASEGAQDIKPWPSYHHEYKPPSSTAPMHASMETAASYHHDKCHISLRVGHHSPPFPIRPRAITGPTFNPPYQASYPIMQTNNIVNTICRSSNHNVNQSFTSTTNALILTTPILFPQSPSNLSPRLANYVDLYCNNEQSSSSTSWYSKTEASPRGPLMGARKFEGAHANLFSTGGTKGIPPA